MRRKTPFLAIITAVAAATSAHPQLARAQTKAVTPSPRTGQDDLTPIGPSEWNYDKAAHLLERAGFGGTPEEIQALAKLTPAQAVAPVSPPAKLAASRSRLSSECSLGTIPHGRRRG